MLGVVSCQLSCSGNGLSVKVSYYIPVCRGICRCWAAVGILLAIVTRPDVGTLCWVPFAVNCPGSGNSILVKVLFVCLFVWFLTTHQPLWVISVSRY